MSTIGDIFPHDIPDTKIAERRDRYEAIAWCLLAVSIASIIFHFIMSIIRGLYLGNIIENSFLTFTIIVSFIHNCVASYVASSLVSYIYIDDL